MFEISVPVGSEDYDLFVSIWNQGIDSRLEAFTQSTYELNKRVAYGVRLLFSFHEDELQILIRRLLEEGTREAEQWADDIVYIQYGVEVI